MHSLLGLSPEGDPLTDVVTWADTRSSEQARRLRASPGGLELHRRTGTPLHPMSPLPKLVWFREQEPKLFEQVGFWVGIKEYVLLRLCDALVVDHSVASATGLLNLASLQWDAEALHLAGLEPEQLAELVADHHGAAGADRRGGRADRAAGPDARSSSARATGRWPTWVSARWPRVSRPARSAPAGRCGYGGAARRSTRSAGCSATRSPPTAGSSAGPSTTAVSSWSGPVARWPRTSAATPRRSCSTSPGRCRPAPAAC